MPEAMKYSPSLLHFTFCDTPLNSRSCTPARPLPPRQRAQLSRGRSGERQAKLSTSFPAALWHPGSSSRRHRRWGAWALAEGGPHSPLLYTCAPQPHGTGSTRLSTYGAAGDSFMPVEARAPTRRTLAVAQVSRGGEAVGGSPAEFPRVCGSRRRGASTSSACRQASEGSFGPPRCCTPASFTSTN